MRTENCDVCGQAWPEKDTHVVVLTDSEKRSLIEQGVLPKAKYMYCKPCFRVLSGDRAPTLMANQFRQQLASAGVPMSQAEKFVTKYRERLEALRKKP